MKISVITMHRIYNYGSVLQAYATQRIFENVAGSCEIIDYISPNRTKIAKFKDCPETLHEKKLRRVIYYIAKIPSFILKDITFGQFYKKYLHLTPQKYFHIEEMIKKPPKADIYVTGSDQVWNSKYNDGVDGSYYLNFISDKKKIAFVSSFGTASISENESRIISPMLKQYSAISVREDEGIEILKRMNINASFLIDPTLQLDQDEWSRISSKRLYSDKYILLFLLYNEDNGASEYAYRMAEEKGLKVVKLSWELRKPKGVDKLFTHRTPQDFLSLFKYADYIVTNSFHGVAFSINFNKQFSFIRRKELNGRIESLLRLTLLENRIVNDLNSNQLYETKINYRYVNEVLRIERNKAKDFLKKNVRL